jgi:DNA-binding phage protein
MSAMDQLISALQHAINSGSTTVAEMAKHGQCSRQYIYNLLERRSEPTISLAEKLAKALGISLVLGVSPKGKRKISA